MTNNNNFCSKVWFKNRRAKCRQQQKQQAAGGEKPPRTKKIKSPPPVNNQTSTTLGAAGGVSPSQRDASPPSPPPSVSSAPPPPLTSSYNPIWSPAVIPPGGPSSLGSMGDLMSSSCLERGGYGAQQAAAAAACYQSYATPSYYSSNMDYLSPHSQINVPVRIFPLIERIKTKI